MMNAKELEARFPLVNPESLWGTSWQTVAKGQRMLTLQQVAQELQMVWSDLTSHPCSPSLLAIEQRILALADDYADTSQAAGGN